MGVRGPAGKDFDLTAADANGEDRATDGTAFGGAGGEGPECEVEQFGAVEIRGAAQLPFDVIQRRVVAAGWWPMRRRRRCTRRSRSMSATSDAAVRPPPMSSAVELASRGGVQPRPVARCRERLARARRRSVGRYGRGWRPRRRVRWTGSGGRTWRLLVGRSGVARRRMVGCRAAAG